MTMKKGTILLLLFLSFFTSAYDTATEKVEHINENEITSQPYKVELIDNTTPQTQNQLTLKVANDINFSKIKVGEKILFVLPSTVNLESGTKIEAGTKFSATIVQKESKPPMAIRVKFIINEIIFEDTTNFIILSKVPKIAPLKLIDAERILGKNAKVTGTFKLGTVIKDVNFSKHLAKMKPDTTTQLGICIMLKINKMHSTIDAGTPITITFEKNIEPEIGLVKE